MTWNEKLGNFERKIDQEKQLTVVEKDKKYSLLNKESQRVFNELEVRKVLEGIKDEFWGTGEIRETISPYGHGFEAQLHFDYPYYQMGHYTSSFGSSPEYYIEPYFGTKKEVLLIRFSNEYAGNIDRGSLFVEFKYAHPDLLHEKRREYSQKFGSEHDNGFWQLYGEQVAICSSTVGQDLSDCKEYLENGLVKYCAVKSLMPHEEILSAKAVDIKKALNGELPYDEEINIDSDFLKIYKEAGLL